VEKHCDVGQGTDYSVVRRIRNACWIPEATNTHRE